MSKRCDQKTYDLDKLGSASHHTGSKALEMIMRDVLDGMEDLANMAGYTPQGGGYFEIIDISPPEQPLAEPSEDKQAEKPLAKVVSIKGAA